MEPGGIQEHDLSVRFHGGAGRRLRGLFFGDRSGIGPVEIPVLGTGQEPGGQKARAQYADNFAHIGDKDNIFS